MPDERRRLLECVSFDGWDYRRPVPADLAEPRYLDRADSWLVFGCILEAAKAGRFDHVDRLPALWQTDDDALRDAARYLFSCVARDAQLSAFDAEITADDARDRMEAASHAARSGSLRFVGVFIAGHRVAFGETARMAMEHGLDNLLVPDRVDRVVEACLFATDRAAGEVQLLALAEHQRERFGAHASLYRGAPLTARAIADDIDEQLSRARPWESMALVQDLVTRLQSMIGFSQHGMFDDARGEWDEALIRRALARARDLVLVPGIRYFFGHPAPL